MVFNRHHTCHHPEVVESAVVGYPHEIKGQGIYAFAICDSSDKSPKELEEEIKEDMKEVSKVELQPKFDGKQMIMVIQPL